MTSFVDRLFLSPEEHAIASEISSVTNPPAIPIPHSVIIQVAESLRGTSDPRLKCYAVKLLTEPFLTPEKSWRGIVGVCSVLAYLSEKGHLLSWLDTIVKLCKEISNGFEHEDVRVTSLVRREALKVVNKYEHDMVNNRVENAVEGKLSHTITTIPAWDELGAGEELARTKVPLQIDEVISYQSLRQIDLEIPSSSASTASLSPRDESSLVSSKAPPLRVRQRPGLLWQWCCCLVICLRCCPTRCLRLLGWQGGDWRDQASSGGID